MFYAYFFRRKLENCESRSWITIEHSSDTARIDKVNTVDYFIIGCMRVAHYMYPKGRVPRQFTEAAFRGVWKKGFIFIVAGAVEYTDTGIANGKIGLSM